jgi:hypothetical protein
MVDSIISEFDKELSRHHEVISEEEKRHNRTIMDICKRSDVIDMFSRADLLMGKSEAINDNRAEFREVFYTFVYYCINDELEGVELDGLSLDDVKDELGIDNDGDLEIYDRILFEDESVYSEYSTLSEGVPSEISLEFFEDDEFVRYLCSLISDNSKSDLIKEISEFISKNGVRSYFNDYSYEKGDIEYYPYNQRLFTSNNEIPFERKTVIEDNIELGFLRTILLKRDEIRDVFDEIEEDLDYISSYELDNFKRFESMMSEYILHYKI